MEDAPLGVPRPWLRRYVRRAVRVAARSVPGPWPPDVELGLLSVPPRRIRELAWRHLGRRRVTDVLSFPQEAPGTIGPLLGDIVICPDVARRNARAAGRAYRDEVAVLALHGLLHLLGYDHEADDGQMRALEVRLRGELRLRRLGREDLL